MIIMIVLRGYGSADALQFQGRATDTASLLSRTALLVYLCNSIIICIIISHSSSSSSSIAKFGVRDRHGLVALEDSSVKWQFVHCSTWFMYGCYYNFNNLRCRQSKHTNDCSAAHVIICLFQVKLWNVGCWNDGQTTLRALCKLWWKCGGFASRTPLASTSLQYVMRTLIYIYICIYRERETHIYIYIYI